MNKLFFAYLYSVISFTDITPPNHLQRRLPPITRSLIQITLRNTLIGYGSYGASSDAEAYDIYNISCDEDDVQNYACIGFTGMENSSVDSLEKVIKFFEENNSVDKLIEKVRENAYEQSILDKTAFLQAEK